jgi:predicted deacetylase
MSLDSLVKTSCAYRFVINKLVKQSAPGKKQPVLVIPKFPDDQRLCVFSVLEEYLARTEALRSQESQLFISFVCPHKKVSKDTIGRWIKHVMKSAGIDTTVYLPHSTRAASTSKANQCNVAITSIMRAASWASDCTFHKFYNKQVGEGHAADCENDRFGQAILMDAIP